MVEKAVDRLRALWTSERFRYIAVGAGNTLFGYLLGVFVFFLLSPALPIVVIGVVGFFAATSLSFVTLRRFVFRQRGPWLWNLLKSYMSYATAGAIGTGLLWVSMAEWHLGIWSAQAVATFVPTVALYFSNKYFVFNSPSRMR
jgi:putative flippase GtrA